MFSEEPCISITNFYQKTVDGDAWSLNFVFVKTTYLCVSGPTMGLASSWTKALDANISPTSTVSSTSSLWRSSRSAYQLALSGEVDDFVEVKKKCSKITNPASFRTYRSPGW